MFELLPLILIGVLFVINRGATKRIDRLERELGDVRERLLLIGGPDAEQGASIVTIRTDVAAAGQTQGRL